jgi:amino acid adenylation domain-containing protein
VSGGNLAYVIYTSGSSGKPKGVMITQGGLVNYLNWCTKAYSVTDGPGTLVNTSIGFDLTITSLFSPLLVGQSVTILPEELAIDGLSLALAGDNDFSLIKITPGHLDMLSQWLTGKDTAVRVRAVVIGGEALHWNSLSFWQTRLPGRRLINEYGPTETVVGCCSYEVPADGSGSGVVPIGRPIANTQIYLLDSYLKPVAGGATGELYVGGEGLARGYLNCPALTAEKFIANPFSGEPGKRLYKTGDLGRFLPSNELEFLGRVDNQVKIRGFRIEPGELEYTLKEHPWVANAVVTVREDVHRDVRLIAYCVMHQPRPTASDELQSFLKEKLPHFMIPAAFVIMGTFPLTINGKVDRAALPAPEFYHAKSEMSYAQPRTEIERTLVGLWQEMLRVKRVGIYDNFFDLGGHSMLLVQLHSKLRSNLNRDIPIIDLFGHPTIGSLAEFLSQQDNVVTAFQAGQDRADNRRTSTKRQKEVRQNHRRPLGLREG